MGALEVITAIAATGGTIGTFVLARLTQNMVTEMKETRRETFRPYLSLGFEIGDSRDLLLVLQNTGNVAAKEVCISITPDLIDITSINWSEQLKNAPTVVPGFKFKTFIDTTINTKDNNEKIYSAKVKYKGASDEEYFDTFILNTEIFEKRRWVKTN